MISASVIAVVAAGLFQQTDTTFSVDPSARLDLNNFGGNITVRTWAQNQVRVQAHHSSRDSIVVDRVDGTVRIRSASWTGRWRGFDIDIDFDPNVRAGEIESRISRRRAPGIIDYEITVPASMALSLGGPYTHVTVEGTEGEVSVAVNEGDVDIRGGRGLVVVRSIEGNVRIENVQATTRVIAIDGEVEATNVRGTLEIETTDGDITMMDVQSTSVSAISVDGDILFVGTVEPQGLYLFSTHEGEVGVAIPETASVRITVATFGGHFESNFPLSVPERIRGRRLNFTLGAGSAQMEIEAFDGDITLEKR